MRPLVIAFIYDSFDSYRAQGFSVEQCQEFDTDETINATIRSLKACGHEVVPVPGIKKLVAMLAKGEHETWDLAFPTAEGMFGAGREAQVSGLLEAYQIPHVFSDAATLSLSHDKARTKMVLEHMGIRTAPFAVVPATSFHSIHEMNSMMADLSSTTLLANAMQFPLFIKPNSEGSSKGIYPFSKVWTMEQLEGGLRELHARYPDQSILVEPFLEGAEYTVSILGTGATAEVIGTAQQDWKASTKEGIRDANYHAFWSQHEPDAEDDHPIRVVSSRKSLEVRQTEDLALQAWRALGCRDIGRVDIRWGRDGLPYVLEINAIPGMRPSYSALTKTAELRGFNHQYLIQAAVNSALERYPFLTSE